MDSNTILWVSTIVLGGAGLLMFLVGKHRTSSEGMQTVMHGSICLIAATSYLAMASGQGLVVLPTTDAVAAGAGVGAGATRLFYYARYVDWAFTTPLLLISLGLSGMHAGPKRNWLLFGAVSADVLMIVTAFNFGASEAAGIKWTWFIISCAAFLGVYYVLWGPQLQAVNSEREDVSSGYKRHAAILSVLWFGYPFVLAVAPDGLNIASDASSVLAIAVLDILSKVVYGFITMTADKGVTDRDLQEPTPLPQAVPVRQPAYAR